MFNQWYVSFFYGDIELQRVRSEKNSLLWFSFRLLLKSRAYCSVEDYSPSQSPTKTSYNLSVWNWRNQLWHTDEAGASLTCYQSTLISGTSFFSQWYFPSSGRSANEILWEIVASSPFLCPSRLRRSLARSRETRFTRPNRRACSRSNLMTLALPKYFFLFLKRRVFVQPYLSFE